MRFTLTAILCLLYLPADFRAHPTEEALEELVVALFSLKTNFHKALNDVYFYKRVYCIHLSTF